VLGSGFRVQGSGFRVQGSGFRVQVEDFQGAGYLDWDDECVDVERDEKAGEEQPRGVEEDSEAQEHATPSDVNGIPRMLVRSCGDKAPHRREIHPRALLRHFEFAGALDLKEDSNLP